MLFHQNLLCGFVTAFFTLSFKYDRIAHQLVDTDDHVHVEPARVAVQRGDAITVEVEYERVAATPVRACAAPGGPPSTRRRR